ncbi:TrkH family potassium uptake protein [Haloglycomyces albus]|uniref:TrkH family potassium uptake protein n=1 Tax=Haloglycomyces albus TaxID=526067 RepID=UPI00046CB1A9|nr:potassium transporter TrkG [Haloglycomyces albus]
MAHFSESFTRHPVRLVPVGFAIGIAVTTTCLLLPIASRQSGSTGFLDALFTGTSAITVTGLITLDTSTHWTLFGEAVIMIAMQIGGIGIMASAAFMGLLVSRRIGLTGRLLTQAELNRTIDMGDLRSILIKAVTIFGIVEAATTLVLSLRFYHAYGFNKFDALWYGLFHGVSSFNSGGFSLFADSLEGYVNDPWIILTIVTAAIIGGLGMPVLFELSRRGWGRHRWSLHTKMTLVGTSLLFALGFVVFLTFEWSNPATMGPFGWKEKILPALLQAVMPRSTGFNSIDVGSMTTESILVAIVLMAIGGGSVSTAGGMKVTTFFLLAWVIWSELRGDPDVSAFRRRIPDTAVRQALSVALIYVALIAVGVLSIQIIDPHFQLQEIMFEATSAAATVGQSTGITAELSSPSKAVAIFLMYVGRIGPVLFATSLAIRTRQRRYRFPEGRPLVG